MRKIRHLAAAAAVAGPLAAGALAASAGTANASTAQVENCTAAGGLIVGVIPTCTSTGTVAYPTSVTLSVSSTELSALLNPIASAVGQGIKDTWHLNCWAGTRQLFSKSGTFSVTSSQPKTSTPLPLGGQWPSKCTVTSTVSTILAVNATLLLNVNALDVSNQVTANTATPGAMWSGNEAVSTRCADVTDNKNADGTKIRIWTCKSDLAQFWVQAPDHELVHNGSCLTNIGGRAYLEHCTGAASQIWSARPARLQEVHSRLGGCLTYRSAANGTQLTITPCKNAANQKWTIPPTAPA